MEIIITHPPLGPQETVLSVDVDATDTTSTVENNTSFDTNDYVVFGVLGEEKTELVLLTSTTGTTVLGHSTGPVFDHGARTGLYQIKYNQAKVYRATSETGTYSLLTTVDLTPDDDVTTYDDTAGTSASWYKVKYYNETTTALSAYSVAVQGTGYTDDSLRSMTDEVLEEFGDPTGKNLTRKQVASHLNAGVRKITTQVFMYFPDYLRTYDTQALTSGTDNYDLPDRFLGFFRVDLNLNGVAASDAYKSSYADDDLGYPDTTYYEANPIITIRGTEFITKPEPTGSGMAFMWFWQAPATMSTESSEHGLPYGARDVLISYALHKAWLPKDEDISDGFKSEYKSSMEGFMDFLANGRQDITSPHVEVVHGSELYE
jgi:hypothetical protein